MTAGQHQLVPAEAAPAETTPDVSISVTTPARLLSVIPHVLGFQPVSSLLIIGTKPPHHTVVVTLPPDHPGHRRVAGIQPACGADADGKPAG